VRAEVRAALAKAILVLPVLVFGARMPKAEELPKDIRGITSKNALLLRHESFDDDTENIVAAIFHVSPRDRPWENKGALLPSIAYSIGGAIAALIVLLVVALLHGWILGRSLSGSIGAPVTMLMIISGIMLGGWMGFLYKSRKR
jgi:hypothetical protein